MYAAGGGAMSPVGFAAEDLMAETLDSPRSGDSISVTIRFRPLSEREYQRGDEVTWYADGDKIVRNVYNPATAYAFDKVYGQDTESQQVYDVAAKPVVKAAMEGANGTVFAYGVTSSGKTHTMHGDHIAPGVIPLAIKDVFSMVQDTPGREFLLRVSYLEIYNEVINDLLDPTGQNLRIREDAQVTYVEGIKEEVVLSPGHALSFIAAGEEHRHVGSNNYNLFSSRSHTIFTLMIESSAHEDEYDGVIFSQLNLIDLAGSESSKTETTGLKRKEGSYINKSLLTLGTVIRKLSEGKASHVPYRDSKLTRLLQSSLSGHGHVSLICTVTPASSSMEETHNTLKFASRAKRVEIYASRNKIIDEKSLIKMYQREISVLKEELDQLRKGMLVGNSHEEIITLKQKLEEDQVKMQSRLEEEEEAKAFLMSRIQRLTKLILVSSKNTLPACLSDIPSHQRCYSVGEDDKMEIVRDGPLLLENGENQESPSSASGNPSDLAYQSMTNKVNLLENNNLSALQKSLTGETSSKVNNKEMGLFMSPGDVASQKHGELLQSIVESAPAGLSLPDEGNKDFDHEGDRDLDLSMTPEQKPPKRRKHRPKVIIEGKPKRTPKSATPKNTEPKEIRTGKRKYVRKNIQKDSSSQPADGTSGTMHNKAAGKGAKSCRRFLDFDPEKNTDKKKGKTVDQQEEIEQGNTRTFDVTFGFEGIHRTTKTNHVSMMRSAEVIDLENEVTAENQTLGATRHMPSNCIILTEEQDSTSPVVATRRPTQVRNLHIGKRHADNGFEYASMRHCSHAEGISKEAMQAKANGENREKTNEKVNQSSCQSALKVMSSTNNILSSLLCQETFEVDGHQESSCTISKEIHKKQKVDNQFLSFHDIPCKVKAIDDRLGRKRVYDQKSNGFAAALNHTILNSYIGSSRMRESDGTNWCTGDRLIDSIHSVHNLLEQQIPFKSNSYQEITQFMNISSDEHISSAPKKSSQRGKRQVLAKKQTVDSSILESAVSTTDKRLQQQSSAYQQSYARALGSSMKNTDLSYMDDIIQRFKSLSIDGSSNKVPDKYQHALVPYKGDGAVVPYEASEFIRKRKPRPKVELDSETNRIWNLLMGKEASEGTEGTDKQKEKYWKEEREVFQGRVDSFIARMHLVQGDRRFSRWKGSVVDSVIGVYLTQNVSDHLSSSAFMSLAARFPLKSASNHQTQDKIGKGILVEEPGVCNTIPDDATKWHEEIISQPINNPISVAQYRFAEPQGDGVTSSIERNLMAAHSQLLEEEFVSSQDSIGSSVTQGTALVKPYVVSNSEAEEPTARCLSNKVHSANSAHQPMDRAPVFQDFYNAVSGKPLFDEGSKHGHKQWGLKTKTDRMDEFSGTTFTNPINLDNPELLLPSVAPSSRNHLPMDLNFGEPEPWGLESCCEESISSCWTSTASRVSTEKDGIYKSLRNKELPGSVVNSSVEQNTSWNSYESATPNPYDALRQRSTDQQNYSMTRFSNEPSSNSHQHEGHQNFQLENISFMDLLKDSQPLPGKKNTGMQQVPNVNRLTNKSVSVGDSISTVNTQMNKDNGSVYSSTKEQISSYGQSQKEINSNVSKGRKGKAESDKKTAVDWDNLRQQDLLLSFFLSPPFGIYKSLRSKELPGSVDNSSVEQKTLWNSHESATPNPYDALKQRSTDQQNYSMTRFSNEPFSNSHQHEGHQNFQLENISCMDLLKDSQPLPGKKNTGMQQVPNVNRLTNKSVSVGDSISTVNTQMNKDNGSVHSFTKEQISSYGQSQKEINSNVSKGKKGKAESDKRSPVDWDNLRQQVQANGVKKERNKDAMNSLDYEALINANVKEISNAIKERGMNNMLAERIQEFLNRVVKDHGSVDLEWLRDVPPDQAKDYLLSIRGLGLKSVECVRLLTLHHLAFPVDTNVGRIAVRLGWVPLQPLPESLQLHLLELYPMLETVQKYLWPRLCKLDQRTLYELHYQMITFGKVFCTKSKPNCNACPMRGECRHFASAFASSRLALLGPEEKSIVSSTKSTITKRNPNVAGNIMALPPPENCSLQNVGTYIDNCVPIIEEPATPEQEFKNLSESDMEDLVREEEHNFHEDEDRDYLPKIDMSVEQFTDTLRNIMKNDMDLQEGDMSKALVALIPKAAFHPPPKLKNVSRLRTEHQVYELPDSHQLLEGMDIREPDDPSPYLLAIWTPGETAHSFQPPESRCRSQDGNKLCNEKTCFSCSSIREQHSQIVRGTILIPCRTAMRGSFPLNGTYFQVNEMFADHVSSVKPINIPTKWIWHLRRRTVYFGTSATSIFRGLTTEEIQYCFWRGYVCVRGFDRNTRAPKPLIARLHFPQSKMPKTKNEK